MSEIYRTEAIKTINVVEQFKDPTKTVVRSFLDTPGGALEARGLFVQILRENEPKFRKRDCLALVESGYQSSNCSVSIIKGIL